MDYELKKKEREDFYEAVFKFRRSSILKECGFKVTEDKFEEDVRVSSKDLNPSKDSGDISKRVDNTSLFLPLKYFGLGLPTL